VASGKQNVFKQRLEKKSLLAESDLVANAQHMLVTML